MSGKPKNNMAGLAMEKNLLRHLWLACGWVMVAFVIWITLTPHPPHILSIFPRFDKLGHFMAYLALMAWFAAALPGRKWLARIMVVLIIMGGLLEILQAFTGRDPGWFDWFLDSSGVLLGATWPRIWLAHLHHYLISPDVSST